MAGTQIYQQLPGAVQTAQQPNTWNNQADPLAGYRQMFSQAGWGVPNLQGNMAAMQDPTNTGFWQGMWDDGYQTAHDWANKWLDSWGPRMQGYLGQYQQA
ncbi:MAG TPA: hypothetical protein VEI97_10525, partial [bacterium]|nr:hypothetical protein [bacterium]